MQDTGGPEPKGVTYIGGGVGGGEVVEGGVWLRSDESDGEGRYEEGKGDSYSEADICVDYDDDGDVVGQARTGLKESERIEF